MQLAYDEDDEEYVELDTPNEADLVAQLREFWTRCAPRTLARESSPQSLAIFPHLL